MIRLSLLIGGFAVSTAALLWSVGEPQSERSEQVSRAGPPDTMSLQPALTLLALPSLDARSAVLTVPEGRIVTSLTPVARSLRPQTRPGHIAPEEVRQEADDDVMTILRAMSYGIVEEMKKPAADVVLPGAVSMAASAPITAPTGRSYTVQSGDSLPGVAFRFYGTTVAYLEILEANRSLMNDPSDMRAGMTLRIPDLN